VCCGSADRCVYIWDTTTKKIVQRLGGHTGTVNQAAMGKDNWLASGSNDKNIIVSQLPEILL
jgi:Prp8 binding protein